MGDTSDLRAQFLCRRHEGYSSSCFLSPGRWLGEKGPTHRLGPPAGCGQASVTPPRVHIWPPILGRTCSPGSRRGTRSL